MTLNEHIDFWIQTSNDDFRVFNVLFDSENFIHAFFISHLCLEKLLKAHWVKANNNTIPPKIHNLITLAKQSNLDLSQEEKTFLTLMNDFQIAGRYPDYKFKIKKILNKEYSTELLPKFNIIRKCLLEKIV